MYHLLFHLYLRAICIHLTRQKNSKIAKQNALQYSYNVLIAANTVLACF